MLYGSLEAGQLPLAPKFLSLRYIKAHRGFSPWKIESFVEHALSRNFLLFPGQVGSRGEDGRFGRRDSFWLFSSVIGQFELIEIVYVSVCEMICEYMECT